MKNTLLMTCSLAAAILAISPVSAQTYKWKDEKGQTIIRDTPPPNSVEVQKTGVRAQPPVQASPVTANGKAAAVETAPKSLAEKDLDFKKRQQEAKEKEEKAAKEQTAATEKRRNCEIARQAINTLQSAGRISTVDEKGGRSSMNEATRQQELQRARKIAEDDCK